MIDLDRKEKFLKKSLFAFDDFLNNKNCVLLLVWSSSVDGGIHHICFPTS